MVLRIAFKTHAWLRGRAVGEYGYLLGATSDVLGALHKLEGGWEDDKLNVEEHLPSGIMVLGLYGPDADALQTAAKILQVAYVYVPDSDGQLVLHDLKGEVQEVEVVDDLLSDYVVLRYCETRDMRNWAYDHEPAWAEAYWSVIPGQLKPVAAGKEGTVPLAEAMVGGGEEAAAGEAASELKPSRGSSKKKKGGGKGGKPAPSSSSSSSSKPPQSLHDVLRPSAIGAWAELSLYERRSPADGDGPSTSTSTPTSASTSTGDPFRVGPYVTIDRPPIAPPPLRRMCTELLVYSPADGPVAGMTTALVGGLRRVWARAKADDREGAIELRTYHVAPPQACGCVFALGLCAPLVLRQGTSAKPGLAQTEDPLAVRDQEDGDEPLKTLRRRLHQRTGLALDRPVFRTSGRLRLEMETATGVTESAMKTARLTCVHVGLPPSGVQGGRQYVVEGPYLYYHYMQDGLDDRGWGCAYRSLQTIASFFLLNHYTARPVPTHTQIQQALVDMGDQPPELVGTKQWIGSLEVGYYLDQELGVTWRNIYTSNGPELAEKARELARHFETQGTPVMMGGGKPGIHHAGGRLEREHRRGQIPDPRPALYGLGGPEDHPDEGDGHGRV